jgi:hypothetical protein
MYMDLCILYSSIFSLYMFRVLLELDRAKSVRVYQPVPAPMDLIYHNHYTHLRLYSAVCASEDGCKKHPKHVEQKYRGIKNT